MGHILRQGPRELGQDLDQGVASRRPFQPPEVLHELRETHNVSFRSGTRHFTGSRGERSTGQAAATRGLKRLSTFETTHSEPRFRALLTESSAKVLFHRDASADRFGGVLA